MRLRRYIVRMRHDRGQVDIHTVARNQATAKELVLRAEHAPPSAVISVRSGGPLFKKSRSAKRRSRKRS